MIPLLEESKDIADQIEAAARRTITSLERGDIKQEPSFTDRLLGRIEDAVNQVKGTKAAWRAHTFTDRGPGAEESMVGADFLGLFEVTTPELTFRKRFLAQAKKLEVGAKLSKGETSRLRQQCSRMLALTPDAFVFLYGMGGVRIVSALAVFSSPICELDQLGQKKIGEFFFDHFRCFIGDQNLLWPWLPGVPAPPFLLREISFRLGGISILRIEAIGPTEV